MKSRRERIIFAKQGGNVLEQEIFREKVKLRKFPTESENFSKTGGKSETGGKCIMVSEGDGRPCLL